VRKNPTGDLYVRVTVVTRLPFRISGSDIITEHNVTLSDLLLEQTLSVPTPDNKTVHIKLSPGFDVTQPVVFRQEGLWRAMQTLGRTGRRGDFVVVLKLKTPHVMGQKAKKLSKELGDELEKEEGRE
jgi:DnaJ-class molecular chaperone